MTNGTAETLQTSGQPPGKTFGAGGVIGLVGLWAFTGFRVLMENVAPEFTADYEGFVETTANLVAALLAGAGRLLYAWIKSKTG